MRIGSAVFLTVGLALTLPSARVACADEPGASSAGVTCRDLPALFQVFTQQHYSVRAIDAVVAERTAEKFIEILDPSKSLLLAADVERLRRDLPAMFGQRDCHLLDDAWDLISKRVAQDARRAATILTPTFELNEDTKLILDPEARKFASSPAARERRVRDTIEFQVSNYLTPSILYSSSSPG